VADYEQPINGEIMKAVASRVTDPKSDVLLLQAVDMEDSGPYEIAEPRIITALETYTPSWLQTPRLKRLAEIVSAQAVLQQQLEAGGGGGQQPTGLGFVNGKGEESLDVFEGQWPAVPNGNGRNGYSRDVVSDEEDDE
jgi:myosin-5